MCKGFYEECNCKDCETVKDLYNDLDWFMKDKETNKDLIVEIENKIEGMGYSI